MTGLGRVGRLISGLGWGRSRLPEHIRQALAAQALESERLIGWAQLAVGIGWSVLYAVSPKTFVSGTGLEPVPPALTFYLAFCLLRLVVTYRISPPHWFLVISVVVDMALLMALIWSFHVQYGQPAAFYLKAPTLLYVFIFIVLRALRFSPGYVILAGAMAALGWLGLLYYALATSTAPGMGITNDYVAYMTSAQVLIGAEFDKIITILLTTVILAVAIVRARRMLLVAVVEPVPLLRPRDCTPDRRGAGPYQTRTGPNARGQYPCLRYPRLHRFGQAHVAGRADDVACAV
jgi:adenylate cyclase